MKELKGKVAVVTGAANGIGRGLAERFIAEGMKVVMSDIDKGELDKAVSDLTKGAAGKAEILAVRTDVSVASEVEALAKASVERFGAVHVLCNNAGVGGFQRFETTSLPTWDWIMGVNLWGPIYGCHYFFPILAKQDEAHIVNTGSVASVVHSGYHHPYNVAKAGVFALSEGLYREWATDHPHIGVTVLCPGNVATSIADDERHAPPGHVPRSKADPGLEPVREYLRGSLAIGKTPAEIAALVVEAIRTKQFYLFTHANFMGLIRDSVEPIFTSAVPSDLSKYRDLR